MKPPRWCGIIQNRSAVFPAAADRDRHNRWSRGRVDPRAPSMLSWLHENDLLLAWLGVLSLVMALGTFAALPLVIVRMPKDYFLRRRGRRLLSDAHPVFRFFVRAVKNVLGVALIALGIAMLVLPGQGILTILVGLTLVDFPGRRALQFRLLRQPKVLDTINWIRAKAGRPALELERSSEDQ